MYFTASLNCSQGLHTANGCLLYARYSLLHVSGQNRAVRTMQLNKICCGPGYLVVRLRESGLAFGVFSSNPVDYSLVANNYGSRDICQAQLG